MKSILKALYMGNSRILGKCLPDDSDYRNALHTINDIKIAFKDKLSAEDANTLEALYNHQQKLIGYGMNESFKSGFCTGALIMPEVLMSRQAQTCD